MQIFSLFLIFSMLCVIWSDVRRYIIPNWLVGSVLVAYPLAVLMSSVTVDWLMAVVGMLSVFGVGYFLFFMRWMGGGDVKLITACALWVGLPNLLEFVFLFGILGGVFSIVMFVVRKLLPFVPKVDVQKLPRILKNGEPIPYGVAIAAAFLVMLWMQKIPVLVQVVVG